MRNDGMIEILHRDHFAQAANARGIVSAVEVGTHRGDYARAFLSKFKGTLRCVDPWTSGFDAAQEETYWPAVKGPRDREPDLAACRAALREFGPRAILLRASSLEAAAVCAMADWKPGFVYLDGDHREEAVAADLAAWWPLVEPGGILAGHDWWIHPPGIAWPGVKAAVSAFAAAQGLAIRTTRDVPSSWWFAKPG